MMKTVLKPELKLKTYCISKSYSRLKEKEISFINFKFYQKLFGSIFSDLELVKAV